MTRLRDLWRWMGSQGPIILAFEMLAFAAVLGAITGFTDERSDQAEANALRDQLERASFEQECRFELSTPVSEIQAQKLDALALGLVAVTEEDDAAVAVQVERIRDLSVREQEALEDRSGAVETCSRRAREQFG